MSDLSQKEEVMTVSREEENVMKAPEEINQVKLTFSPVEGANIVSDAFSRAMREKRNTVNLKPEDFKPVSVTINNDNVEFPLEGKGIARNNHNEAIEIRTGVQYGIDMPEDNNLWLWVDTTGKAGKKLNIVSYFPNATSKVRYGIALYRLDVNTSTLYQVYTTDNLLMAMDNLGFIPNGGIYFINFVHFSGERYLSFYIDQIDNIHGSEPNENPYQASQYTGRIRSWEYVDGNLDYDWLRLKTVEAGTYYISVAFTDNTVRVPFELYLFNMTKNTYSGIVLNTPLVGVNFDAKAGEEYAIGIIHPAEAIGKEYLVIVDQRKGATVPAHVEMTKMEGGTECEYISSIGYWRLVGHKVGGKLKLTCNTAGESGIMPITVATHGRLDSQGKIETYSNTELLNLPNFEISVRGPMSSGKDGSLGGHDYDFNNFTFYDFSGKAIDCNILQYLNYRN